RLASSGTWPGGLATPLNIAISDRRFLTFTRFTSLIENSRLHVKMGPLPKQASGRRQLEYLAQIGQIGGIVAHCLLGRIRYLGDRLSIAPDHLHDYLQRLMPQIVGQVGAYAERDLAAASETLGQLDGARERQG